MDGPSGEGNGNPLQHSCLENPMDGGAWWAAVHGVVKSWTRLSNFPFTFHFHALEKELATHSSVLALRIPGTGEPGGLPVSGVAQSRTRLKRLSLEIFIVSEVRQKWKDKYYIGIMYMCDLKNSANNLCTKQSHKHRKQHMVTKGGNGGRDKLGIWD